MPGSWYAKRKDEWMATNIEKVKNLREMTGGAVLDCKRALDEADGDIEAAA